MGNGVSVADGAGRAIVTRGGAPRQLFERINGIDVMDMRNTDLNLLRAFDALIAERSVSRAAERLCLSQPATSALLARLRELFGDPLLVRSGRAMVPTAQALALAGPIRNVLTDIHDILDVHGEFVPARSERTYTLATSEYGASVILPALAAQMAAAAPLARLALLMPTLDTMVKDMETGRLDAAILNEDLVPAGLRMQALYDDGYCVVARPGHPGVGPRLTLQSFCSLPQLLVSPRGGGFSAKTDEALAALGRQRNVRLSVPHFRLAAELVAGSDLIAVYPRRLAEPLAGRLQLLVPPLAIPPLTMCLCWHARVENEAAHQWLCAQIRQALSPHRSDSFSA